MQGFNMGRYLPPASLDKALSQPGQKTTGFNEGTQKKRGPAGEQTVRFEMPFAIWCQTCQPEAIIGQGIRFNAEKKKVGNYYSTPIWSFRMKHGACGGTIEIRTDPQQREYIVHEGGRRRETGAADDSGGMFGTIITAEEREKRRTDAFAQLEGKKEDATTARTENDKVQALLDDRNRHWEDTYSMNQRLRKSFRNGRKNREAEAKDTLELETRFGLGMPLLESSQQDADRAALIEFDSPLSLRSPSSVTTEPLFAIKQAQRPHFPGVTNGSSYLAGRLRERSVKTLQVNVRSRTMAISDPFLVTRSNTRDNYAGLAGLKRKRKPDDEPPGTACDVAASATTVRPETSVKSLLSGYESSSD